MLTNQQLNKLASSLTKLEIEIVQKINASTSSISHNSPTRSHYNLIHLNMGRTFQLIFSFPLKLMWKENVEVESERVLENESSIK